jgi:hypothetical protein
MSADKRLKISAVAFALLWTLWMLWWSGEYHPAHIAILSITGAATGFLWYRAMQWWARRMGV